MSAPSSDYPVERRVVPDRRRGVDRRIGERRRGDDRREALDRRAGEQRRFDRRLLRETAAQDLRNALQLLTNLAELGALRRDDREDLEAAVIQVRVALAKLEAVPAAIGRRESGAPTIGDGV
jgi:hypothetical protein